jgi:hypothetical protein
MEAHPTPSGTGAERDEETARLRREVARLEADNRMLRDKVRRLYRLGASAPRASVPEAETHEHAVLRADPRRINLATLGLNDRRRPKEFRDMLRDPEPAVAGGDWDRGAWGVAIKEFDQTDVWRAFRGRFVDGGAWEETAFYRRVISQIAAGTPRWGCATKEQFRVRCEALDRLYDRIRDEGYKSQVELGTGAPVDEIRVGICRDGRLLLFDGRHRLAIARILGLSEVPVRVVVRHREWVSFKVRMREFVERKLHGRAYQEIDHPDLRDFPARHGRDRLEILQRALAGRDWTGKRLLDLGTHWGYMAQQMEKLGFACTAIEANPEFAYYAERLRVATESSYELWIGNLFDYPSTEVDVVLALSIFHHMLKREDRFYGLIEFLNKLSTRMLIFEPHVPELSATQMKGAYADFAPDEFVAFVSEHAGLGKVQFLGAARDKRPLYMLTR